MYGGQFTQEEVDAMETLRSPSLIHPRARSAFMAVLVDLKSASATGASAVEWGIFETYRSPERQAAVYEAGNSKAVPYASAHQFGLAVDFVPKVGGKWTWEPPGGAKEWDLLRSIATRNGLLSQLDWDRAHVEHPLWVRVRQAFL